METDIKQMMPYIGMISKTNANITKTPMPIDRLMFLASAVRPLPEVAVVRIQALRADVFIQRMAHPVELGLCAGRSLGVRPRA